MPSLVRDNPTVARGRFHLTFPERLIDEPVVHTLGTRFGIVTNIRRANINERSGWVILEMEGPDDRMDEALSWLVGEGVRVERIDEEAG